MSKETNSAQDFDRVFREKLEGHAVAPPAGMWENISANTQASKRKRGLLWIITSDTTIMLLILLTSFLMLFGEGADILANISNSETDSLAETTEMANEKREAMNTVKSEMATSEPEFISSSENSTVTENKTDRIDHLETEAVESNSKATSTFVTADMNSNYKGKGDVENLSSEATNNLSSNETASSAIKKDEVPSDDNSAEQRFKRVDEPKASAIETDDREEEGLEENESLAADNVGKRGVEKQVSNQNESMSEKLRQMALIKPYLIGAFEEDSLKNFEAPTMPIQDLIGTKDHEVFVGAHVNFNLPLIFNQNTYGAFDGKELAYKPTFGLASGARIGYTFKRQYGFQTGFIFYSQQGQNYEDNLNGFAARRQVKLQYFHVPMVLRYKFKIKKQQKFESPWVINLGADVGILRSAEITYDGNEYPLGTITNPETNDMNYFKPIDISVVLGVEKEIYFTKWLMMSIGMRTTFSGDINADGHPVENDGKNYDKSHNFTFGFTLGLNYYMRR